MANAVNQPRGWYKEELELHIVQNNAAQLTVMEIKRYDTVLPHMRNACLFFRMLPTGFSSHFCMHSMGEFVVFFVLCAYIFKYEGVNL